MQSAAHRRGNWLDHWPRISQVKWTTGFHHSIIGFADDCGFDLETLHV
jgi:hypothetical protein